MADLPVENVQQFPTQPAMQIVPDLVRVEFNGNVLVESARAVRVLERHFAPAYYIPRDDWAGFCLRAAHGTTVCQWKGRATWWDVISGSRTALRAAWSFEDPKPNFAPLAGHVAVLAGLMGHCWVGDNRVLAQPDPRRNGWVTANLRGILEGGQGLGAR